MSLSRNTFLMSIWKTYIKKLIKSLSLCIVAQIQTIFRGFCKVYVTLVEFEIGNQRNGRNWWQIK